MEKELAQGSIGSIGKYEVAVHGGEVVATASAQAGPAEIEVSIKLEGKSVLLAGLDWLKQKIPGNIDDLAIDLIEERIKSI